MKNVRSMFAAMTLGLILSSATLAGDVSTPGYVPPPPPPSTAQPMEQDEVALSDDMGSSSFATDFLVAALYAFYQ